MSEHALFQPTTTIECPYQLWCRIPDAYHEACPAWETTAHCDFRLHNRKREYKKYIDRLFFFGLLTVILLGVRVDNLQLTMSSWTVVEFGKASMMTKKMDRDRTIIIMREKQDPCG